MGQLGRGANLGRVWPILVQLTRIWAPLAGWPRAAGSRTASRRSLAVVCLSVRVARGRAIPLVPQQYSSSTCGNHGTKRKSRRAQWLLRPRLSTGMPALTPDSVGRSGPPGRPRFRGWEEMQSHAAKAWLQGRVKNWGHFGNPSTALRMTTKGATAERHIRLSGQARKEHV